MSSEHVDSILDLDKASEYARTALGHLLHRAATAGASVDATLARQIWTYEVELQRLKNLREGLVSESFRAAS